MNHPHRQGPPRLPFVDALKAIGAQFVVLHHLAYYGPMSDQAWVLLPEVIDWMEFRSRIALALIVALTLGLARFRAGRSTSPGPGRTLVTYFSLSS